MAQRSVERCGLHFRGICILSALFSLTMLSRLVAEAAEVSAAALSFHGAGARRRAGDEQPCAPLAEPHSGLPSGTGGRWMTAGGVRAGRDRGAGRAAGVGRISKRGGSAHYSLGDRIRRVATAYSGAAPLGQAQGSAMQRPQPQAVPRANSVWASQMATDPVSPRRRKGGPAHGTGR